VICVNYDTLNVPKTDADHLSWHKFQSEGNSLDKLRHPRSDAYSAEQVNNNNNNNNMLAYKAPVCYTK